jgi:antitoxin component of MazEF toxin-antitoxin module
MRVPASVLHALGVTSTAALEDDVDVDVIVGEDGVARALSLNP